MECAWGKKPWRNAHMGHLRNHTDFDISCCLKQVYSSTRELHGPSTLSPSTGLSKTA